MRTIRAARNLRSAPRRQRLGTQTGKAAFLATGPTAWYDARDLLTASQTTLTNRVGTSTATLTNGPIALNHSGTSYVYLPGVATSHLSVPDEAALDITGDIDIRYKMNGLYTAGDSILVAKYTAGQLSYRLRARTAGTLDLFWTEDGSTVKSGASTAAVGATDSTDIWVRVTLDVDNGASGYDLKFWKSTDGSSWTQVGTTVVGGAATSIHAGTSTLRIGTDGAGNNPLTHRFLRAIVKDGIDGTTVLDINPAVETLGHASWTCTTGQTVTVNRGTSGLVTSIVSRGRVLFDGSNDQIALDSDDTPTFDATTGEYTVMLINRVHNLAGAATLSRVWSSESAEDVGAYIYLDQTNAQYKALVGGATTAATDAAAFTATTQLHAVAAVFDTGTAYAYSTTTGLTAGADYSAVGTVTHAAAPVVGTRADTATTAADFVCYAAVHWTRALTEAELAAAASYLLGTYV